MGTSNLKSPSTIVRSWVKKNQKGFAIFHPVPPPTGACHPGPRKRDIKACWLEGGGPARPGLNHHNTYATTTRQQGLAEGEMHRIVSAVRLMPTAGQETNDPLKKVGNPNRITEWKGGKQEPV